MQFEKNENENYDENKKKMEDLIEQKKNLNVQLYYEALKNQREKQWKNDMDEYMYV